MSLKSKRELLSVTAHRYQTANKKQKQKILDEFVAATGYHRQYAIPLLKHYQADPSKGKSPGVLNQAQSPRGRKKGRWSSFGPNAQAKAIAYKLRFFALCQGQFSVILSPKWHSSRP